MEIVTITKDESINYSGKLVTASLVCRILTGKMRGYRGIMRSEFNVFSYEGAQMRQRNLSHEEELELIESSSLLRRFKFGPNESYYQYGYDKGHVDFLVELDDRAIYIFYRLSLWSRKRLYVSASRVRGSDHLALMFPWSFQQLSRGFMIEEEVLNELYDHIPATQRMFDVLPNTLVVVID